MEDYYLLFRTGKSLEFDFKGMRLEKIGTLRAFVRSKGKIKAINAKELDETEFFGQLKFEMLGIKPEEELFDILGSSHGEGSSDEDILFEN